MSALGNLLVFTLDKHRYEHFVKSSSESVSKDNYFSLHDTKIHHTFCAA